jgi:transcriptional antiterminator/mannitol/fructose-specific phosphotransferase system IIA component (Ntr-type)
VGVKMLNSRCSNILKWIINSSSPIVIRDIANKFNISSRTIRYDLDKINEYLKEIGSKELTRKTNEGISIDLSEEEIKRILNLIGQMDNYDYVLDQNERIVYIICELLGKNDYITISKLADNMFVSRGTINNDLKEVKKWCEKNNIKLEIIKGRGIKTIGEERELRKVTSSLLFENTDTSDLFNISLLRMFNGIDIDFISNLIKISEEQMGNTLSDYAFNNLLIHIAIAIKRIELSKDIVMDNEELKNLSKIPEFAIASGIARGIEDKYCIKIPMSEIGYITIHLLGSNVMLNEEKNDDYIYIQLIVSKLIENVHKKSKYNFNLDEQLFDGLIQHIIPMIYRLKHSININNPLIEDIKSKYGYVFNCVREGLMLLKGDFNIGISEEEIGYVTLHFMASLERMKNVNKRKPRVLVVCATGVGTSKFVSIKLKSIFDINIIDTISSHDIKKIIQNQSVDLIITTIPIEVKGIRCILVNPFLSEKNVSELSLFLSKYSLMCDKINNEENETGIDIYKGEFYNSNSESRIIDLNNILQIINKNCTINNFDILKEELTSYLNVNNKKYMPLLKEIINTNFIKVNEEVQNWEEAIIKGGEILKKNGCVNDSYINAMINNVKKLTPYIVILPGIAMPHARPEEGSFKIGLSIMTLKNPITFGNIENDPVQLIITMSAIDNISHIHILKEIMAIIEKDNFMENVISSKTEDDILRLITL